MVQLNILSGKQAGSSWAARRFPVRVGRGATADLQADDAGVWDDHVAIDLDPSAGFLLQACPEAVVHCNGEPVCDCVLRNGDVIELGALKLQFWLAEGRQRGLAWREILIWTGIIAVSIAQIGLLYWLPK